VSGKLVGRFERVNDRESIDIISVNIKMVGLRGCGGN
jgi:hypothetical protein